MIGYEWIYDFTHLLLDMFTFTIIGYRFATLLALLKETVQLPAKYAAFPHSLHLTVARPSTCGANA